MTDEIKDITDQYKLEELQASQARRLKKNFPVSIEEELKDYVPGNYKTVERKELKLEYSNTMKASFHKLWKDIVSADLVVTEHNQQVVRQVLNWMTRLMNPDQFVYVTDYGEKDRCTYPDQADCLCSKLDPAKGLFIWGDYGRGKSKFIAALIQAMNGASKHYKHIPTLKAFDYKQMIETAKKDANTNNLYRTRGCITIDDFGWIGEGQLKIYGNDINLISKPLGGT